MLYHGWSPNPPNVPPPPRNKGLIAGLIKGNQRASIRPDHKALFLRGVGDPGHPRLMRHKAFFPTVPVPRRMMHTYTGTFLLMFIAIFSCGAAYITCAFSFRKIRKGDMWNRENDPKDTTIY